jgi:alcohol dehydrogenase (NADP+)
MLELAARKRLYPMIEAIDLGGKRLKEAVERLKKKKVRYRFTMVNCDKAFPNKP